MSFACWFCRSYSLCSNNVYFTNNFTLVIIALLIWVFFKIYLLIAMIEWFAQKDMSRCAVVCVMVFLEIFCYGKELKFCDCVCKITEYRLSVKLAARSDYALCYIGRLFLVCIYVPCYKISSLELGILIFPLFLSLSIYVNFYMISPLVNASLVLAVELSIHSSRKFAFCPPGSSYSLLCHIPSNRHAFRIMK